MEYMTTRLPSYDVSETASSGYNNASNYSREHGDKSARWVGPPGCTCNGGLCRKTCGGVRA